MSKKMIRVITLLLSIAMTATLMAGCGGNASGNNPSGDSSQSGKVSGMLEEVKAVYEKGINDEHQAYKAIGCRQLIDYFNGLCSFEESVEKIKQESRRYAKRQLTWMRAEDAIWHCCVL